MLAPAANQPARRLSGRPHGHPQRRPTERSRRGRRLFAVTSAEYFYDYASQDPINEYDLSGECTPWKCIKKAAKAVKKQVVATVKADPVVAVGTAVGKGAVDTVKAAFGHGSVDVSGSAVLIVGVTGGISFGKGGIVIHGGFSTGAELAASAQYSPSNVNRGIYGGVTGCDGVTFACGSADWGPKSGANASFGPGIGLGFSADVQYGWRIKK